MAGYDYFSNFIQGLQMAQSIKERKAEEDYRQQTLAMQKEKFAMEKQKFAREEAEEIENRPYELIAKKQALDKGFSEEKYLGEMRPYALKKAKKEAEAPTGVELEDKKYNLGAREMELKHIAQIALQTETGSETEGQDKDTLRKLGSAMKRLESSGMFEGRGEMYYDIIKKRHDALKKKYNIEEPKRFDQRRPGVQSGMTGIPRRSLTEEE